MTLKGSNMKLRNIILSSVLAVSCLFCSTGCSKKSSVGNIGEITFADGDKIAEIVIEDYGTIKAKLFPDLAPNAVDNFVQLSEQGYYDGLKIHRVIKDFMIQGGSLNGDGTGGKAVINETGSFSLETSDKARNFYGALGYANVNGENTTQFYIVNNKTPIDITKYNTELLSEKAAEISEKLAGMDAESSEYKELNAQLNHYNALIPMLTKASDAVKERYAEVGGIPHWDGGYTVFGQVYEGFDVLNKISAAEVTANISSEVSKPVTEIVISTIRIVEYKTPETAEAKDSKDKTSKTSAPENDPAGTGEAALAETGTAEAVPAQSAEAEAPGEAATGESSPEDETADGAIVPTSQAPFGTLEANE